MKYEDTGLKGLSWVFDGLDRHLGKRVVGAVTTALGSVILAVVYVCMFPFWVVGKCVERREKRAKRL